MVFLFGVLDNIPYISSMTNNNYIRIPEKSTQDKFREIGLKVQKGLVKFAYYETDNSIGYFYYLKLK